MTCAPDVGEVCPDVLSWRTGDHGGEVALQEQPGLLAEELVTLGHLEHVDSLRDNLDGQSMYVGRRGEEVEEREQSVLPGVCVRACVCVCVCMRT